MTEYLNLIYKYLSYIDWVNLTLLYSIILIFWNWFTLISNFHARANSAFEFYLRHLTIIPFWIIFIIYLFNFTSPINFNSLTKTFPKEIIIENNLKNDLELNFYGKGKKGYYQLFNNYENYLNPVFSFDKKTKNKLTFEIDTSLIKYIYVTKNIDNLNFSYTQAFEVNNTKLILYGDEFVKNPSRKVDLDYSYYYKLMLIFLLAVTSSWYYYFLSFMKKNKKLFMIISISISSIVFIALFLIFRIFYLNL